MPVPVPERQAQGRREDKGRLLLLRVQPVVRELLAQREVRQRVQLAEVVPVLVLLLLYL